MFYSKSRLIMLAVVTLLFMMITTSASAWEFILNGEYEYRYMYMSRTGPNDLFGNVNVAQSVDGFGMTSIGLSGRHGRTVMPETYSVKGSSGSWGEQRFVLFPSIKVNNAVKVRGEYAVQGNLNADLSNIYGNGAWIMPTSRGEESKIGMAYGQFRSLWATIITPMGIIDVGRRPFGYGLGWAGYHMDNFATSAVMITVPYGPLSFMFGADVHDSGEYSDPYDIRNTNLTPLTIASAVDDNEKRSWAIYGGAKYVAGQMDIGTLGRYVKYDNVHSEPYPVINTIRDDMTDSFAKHLLGTRIDLSPIYADVTLWNQLMYFKWINGKFFLNGEYAFQYVSAHRNGRMISGWPKAYMAEGGFIVGPCKLTLAYFNRSGHERSGAQLDTESELGQNMYTGRFVSDKWSQYMMFGGGDGPIKPYTFLLALYGAGNNSFDRVGDATFLDFKAPAVRIDYAVASNMNVWGSYIYAQRESNTGSWYGQYSGGTIPTEYTGMDVPNDNLGSEFNVGIDWKLLENVCMNTKFGWWHPGEWFSYAYKSLDDRMYIAVPNTDGGPDPEKAIKVRPNRNIDPIIGIDMSVLITF